MADVDTPESMYGLAAINGAIRVHRLKSHPSSQSLLRANWDMVVLHSVVVLHCLLVTAGSTAKLLMINTLNRNRIVMILTTLRGMLKLRRRQAAP